MISLRIICTKSRTAGVLKLLEETPEVASVVVLREAGIKPEGDMILCDIENEVVSDVISDLRGLGVEDDGSIALDRNEIELSSSANRAQKAVPRSSADAVVWEEVEAQTSESAEISGSFLIFMVVAVLIAASGIYRNSAILIIGAMIVGPDYGPISGMCVALLNREAAKFGKSFGALLLGFALAIVCAYLGTVILQQVHLIPESFSALQNSVGRAISHPTILTTLIAALAGVAGMLALTTSKSGPLIGVLVSVNTVPAAAGIAVAAAYGARGSLLGSTLQLVINVVALVAVGLLPLIVQRLIYRRRRRIYLRQLDRSREAN